MTPPAQTRTFGSSASARPGEAAGDARARARDVGSLEELEALLAGFDGCPLKFTAKNLVFADGNPAAKLMFIGEAPGADEDRIGKPFMGRSGKLLDRMMAAVGLDRSSAYVTNIVPWRPPGNRNPTPQEVAICKPFIERQIELADPDLIVCLGSPATQAITGTKDGILKARGRFYPYRVGDREIRALATLHPAYFAAPAPAEAAGLAGLPHPARGPRREGLSRLGASRKRNRIPRPRLTSRGRV